MQIKDIMTRNVITVFQEDSVSDVAKKLSEKRIHGVPVVDGKHLVGIITETDFFTKGEVEIHLPTYIDMLEKSGSKKDKEAGLGGILTAKAGDIMTSDCITVNPEDDINKFVSIVKENDVHTVPVTIGDVLVGVVTVADIIKLL